MNRSRATGNKGGTTGPTGTPASPARQRPSAPPRPVPQIPDHELLRVIGEGSYGEVWLARNIMGAWRAVKVVYRRAFEHERPYEREFEGVQRFEPISRRHESHVDVLHVGRNEPEGYFYYVMELADDASAECGVQSAELKPDHAKGARDIPHSGLRPPHSYVPHTLKLDLERSERMPCEECLRLGLDLTTALEHLHDHDLVHRDIKPSNIIFVNGVLKLADPGLVTTTDATLSYVGTLGYVPPEGAGTPQADLYSLGKVLYEACMGRDRLEFPKLPPGFDDTSTATDLLEFNQVLLKACEVDPQKRYASARAMHADLQLLQAGKSVKRLRRLERRLAVGRKVTAVLAGLTLIAGGAFYQAHRSDRIKSQLLSRMQVTAGAQQLARGNLVDGLVRFVEALRLNPEGSEAARLNRLRINAVLEQCPKPIGLMAQAQGDVADARFSPDGQWLVTRGADRWARIWEVASGSLKHALPHNHPVLYAAFSPDSARLVTVTADDWAHVWNVASGRETGPPLRHLPLGRRGTYCFYYDADAFFLRKLNGNQRLFSVKPATNKTTRVTIALSFTGQTNQVILRARVLDRDKPGRVLVERSFTDTAMADPLARGTDWPAAPFLERTGVMILALWHAMDPDRPERSELRLDAIQITQRTAAATNVYRDDFTSPTPQRWVFGPRGSFVITNGQLRVTSGHDLTRHLFLATKTAPLVRIEPGTTLELRLEMDNLRGTESGVLLGLSTTGDHDRLALMSPRFSPDSRRLATLVSPWEAQLWNLDTGAPEGNPILHDSGVQAWKFSTDGQSLLTIARHHAVRARDAANFCVLRWDTATRQLCGAPVPMHHESGVTFQFSPDDRVVATDSYYPQLLDTQSGAEVAPNLPHGEKHRFLAFSPDGARVVTSAEDNRVRLWNVATGELLGQPLGPYLNVRQVGFSPDGEMIFLFTGSHLILCDATTGHRLYAPIPADGIPATTPFSPDGRLLVTLHHEHGLRLWDLAGAQMRVVPLDARPGRREDFASADGRWRAEFSGLQTIRVTSTGDASGAPATIQSEQGILRAWFTANDHYLVTEYEDQTAQAWELATARPLTPPFTFQYAMGAPPTPELDLQPIDWPLPDLIRLAEYLGGQRLNATGNREPLSGTALTAHWQQLRSRIRRDLAAPPDQVAAWHREAVARSEQNWHWEAAAFHRKWLRRLAPCDRPCRRLYDYAVAAASQARQATNGYAGREFIIPPRHPLATSNTLDLSAYYTASLKEPFGFDVQAYWRGLPAGLRRLAGVEFELRGFIVLGHTRLHGFRAGFTNRCLIPLGRPVQQLHFLQAAIESAEDTGDRAGTYVIHHANGEQSRIPLVTGRDLLAGRTAPEDLVVTDAEIAWYGANAASHRRGLVSDCLTCKTWVNEHPEWGDITYLELLPRPGKDQRSLLVAAISME